MNLIKLDVSINSLLSSLSIIVGWRDLTNYLSSLLQIRDIPNRAVANEFPSQNQYQGQMQLGQRHYINHARLWIVGLSNHTVSRNAALSFL